MPAKNNDTLGWGLLVPLNLSYFSKLLQIRQNKIATISYCVVHGLLQVTQYFSHACITGLILSLLDLQELHPLL